MWKEFGIATGHFAATVNYVQHPTDDARKLFFLADGPHLLKNVKSALASNLVFVLSPEIVEQFKLPSNLVCIEHIHRLVDFQATEQLQLTPGLAKDHLTPGHFDKVKVNIS